MATLQSIFVRLESWLQLVRMARVKKSLCQNHTGGFVKKYEKNWHIQNVFHLRVKYHSQKIPANPSSWHIRLLFLSQFFPNTPKKLIEIREDLRELIDGCMQRELGVPLGGLGAEDSCDSTMGHGSQVKWPFQSSHSCNVGMKFMPSNFW